MGSRLSIRRKSTTNSIETSTTASSKPVQSTSSSFSSSSRSASPSTQSATKGKRPKKKDSLSVQPRAHRASNSCSSNSYTFIKRVNALDRMLRVCKEEQEHWASVLATLEEQEQQDCDTNHTEQHTQQCLYVLSCWWRQCEPSFSCTTHSTVSTHTNKPPLDCIVAFCDPVAERGLFGHCKQDQFAAYKLWASSRSEWVQHKTSLLESIKDELLQYEMDWDSNEQKKKHWRCQICKHSRIHELFIEHEQDTSYDYNYRRECSKTDFQFAYNVMISCKTKRISLDTGKLVPCHHSMYLHHNLRKYMVVPRYVMHRCRACNHNHSFVDREKYRECDHCHHEQSKHDQVWCKHADEFDGSEEVVTRKVKDLNGNWT